MTSLLHSILSTVWMIDPMAVNGFLPNIGRLIEGKKVVFPQDKFEAVRMVSASAVSSQHGSGKGTKKESTIAIVSIKGVITKNDQFCGGEGTESRISTIKALINDKSVDAIVLSLDTPGGEATMLETLAKTIESSHKPILSYFSGMCASAGYYIASASKEIYAAEATDIVGSIGVVASFADFRGHFEKKGIVLHEIYADQSSEKNGDFKAALDGDYTQIKEDILNPFADQFIAAVKRNRDITNEKKVFKGGAFLSNKAIKLGLIDGIKTFDEVLERAAELAESTESTDKKENTSDMKHEFEATAELLGHETIESHDGMISLSVEDFAKIEAGLTPKSSIHEDEDEEKEEEEEEKEENSEEEKSEEEECECEGEEDCECEEEKEEEAEKEEEKEEEAPAAKEETPVAEELLEKVSAQDEEITALKAKLIEYGAKPADVETIAGASTNEFEEADAENWPAPDLSINKPRT